MNVRRLSGCLVLGSLAATLGCSSDGNTTGPTDTMPTGSSTATGGTTTVPATGTTPPPAGTTTAPAGTTTAPAGTTTTPAGTTTAPAGTTTPPAGTTTAPATTTTVPPVGTTTSTETTPTDTSTTPTGTDATSTTTATDTTPPPAGTGTPPAEGGPSGTPTDCTVTVSKSEVSSKIATVGIVEWSTDLASPTAAWIEFGKDTSYGLLAPVDLSEPSFRTLLLGMADSSMYNYRVLVQSGDQLCTGANQTITTGPLPNDVHNLDVTTTGMVDTGFIVTSTYSQGTAGPAYILNEMGEPVWYYKVASEPTRARQSYDGKYMWIAKANVPGGQGANGGAQMFRVSMDGLVEEDHSAEFASLNHDFAVAPDESVFFAAYNGSCDDIKERKADGTVRTIVNSGMAHGESGACHVNAIHYSREDDTVVFSDLNHNNYTKVKRTTGETVWVLGGGSKNQFTGDGASWDHEHGFHLLGLDRLLIFNNDGGGSATEKTSLAVEIQLDLTNKTATRSWQYSSGLTNKIMGDVQRLSNGNTLVTYSVSGVIQEVSAEKVVQQEIKSSGAGSAFGYAEKRKTLYGPGPR